MRDNYKYSQAAQSIAGHINNDLTEFSENYDPFAPPVGMDMGGHDTYLMGPKAVMLDTFVVDLLHVDTSAQTFRLKLLLNMDWEDDGTIQPEVKAKRNLGRTAINMGSSNMSLTSGTSSGMDAYVRAASSDGASSSHQSGDTYRTGKYVLKREFREDPLATTWNPEVVLVNAISDEDPIEAGSKFHSVQMLSGRPVISRSVLYQPECRCKFTFSNFPFDETDLVVKFSSNKWDSEKVAFLWSSRLNSMGRDANGRRISTFAPRPQQPGGQHLRRESSFVRRTVDKHAIGGVGLSEFEIVKVRVETSEKDVNSMQRYDNAEGAFSQAHLIMRVRRDPYSYLLRVASVAELLMFLEALSFLTDNDGLADRFSISGTIFLAMVSLYGPMADALPKVSVVTRVDKWHLYNFVLLFVSNIENLVAFSLRNIVNKTAMEYTESLLGIVYLVFVTKNLLWFIQPLRDRDEYTEVVAWFEDARDSYKEKLLWAVDRVLPWRRGRERPPEGRKRTTSQKNWGTAGNAVRAATRIRRLSLKNKAK